MTIPIFALAATDSFAEAKMAQLSYHGCNQAVVFGNGVMEEVGVPQFGRVMQSRFKGEDIGSFWENRSWDGKSPNSQSVEWINIGGDKTCPAPQGEWAKITGCGGPPPIAAGAMSVNLTIRDQMRSRKIQVDPRSGIQDDCVVTALLRSLNQIVTGG